MLFSIIVPIYNAEQYLPLCIESLLAQTVKKFELLLINDGSSDSSLDICDRYAKQDSRIRVFSKPNGGVSSARNLGLDNATGDYIIFVDADDMLVPDALETIAEHTPEYDIVRFSAARLYPKGHIILQKIPRATSRDKALGLVISRRTFVGVAGGAFRRELFDKHNIRFDCDIALGEDWLVLAFLTYYCRNIKTLRKSFCYIYNKANMESCTNTLNEQRLIQQFAVLRTIKSLVKEGYEADFSRTRCLIINEFIDFFGIEGCCQRLRAAGDKADALSLRDIILADISLRKRIKLTRIWFKMRHKA